MCACESHALLHREPRGYLPGLVHAEDGYIHSAAAIEKLSCISLFLRSSGICLAQALREFDIQAFAFRAVGELVLLLLVSGEPRRAALALDWNGGYTLWIVAKVLRSAAMLFYFIGTGLGQVAGPMMALMHLLFQLL